MISMQYAKNLSAGNGLVWNAGGERVQGITNLGVTLVMAGLHWLPVGPFQISLAFQLLNLLMLAATLLLVWYVARRAFGGNAWIAAGSVLAVVICGPLHIWSLQGSDTGAMGLWLMTSVAVLARAGGGWPRSLFWILAVGILIRPDASIFYAVFLAMSLGSPGNRLRRLLDAALPFAVVWCGLLLFGQLYYGDPLPNTFYLKATGSPVELVVASGVQQIGPWLAQQILGLVLAAVALLRFRGNRVVTLSLGLFAAALFYHVWVGGDWLSEYGSRFVVPALPLFQMIAVAGAWALFERRLPRARLPLAVRRPAFLAVSLVAGFLVNPYPTYRDWFHRGAGTMYRAQNQFNFVRALYFRDATVPSTSVAVHSAGVPIYFSGRRGIDVFGLSDRHIARLQVDHFYPGHSKWDWDYVVGEQKPDIIMGVSHGLYERPDFRAAYYLVTKDSSLQFFVRKDALSKLIDENVQLTDLVTGQRFEKRRGGGREGPRRAGRERAAYDGIE